MSSTTRVSVQAVKVALKLLVAPKSVIELRIPKAGKYRTVSGYFDNSASLVSELEKVDGLGEGKYFTLNPVNPALLARYNNRMKRYAENTTTDADILEIRFIPLDFD